MSASFSQPIRNVIGPKIQKLRQAKGWSQIELVGKLQLGGWDIERTVLTKIENGHRCITDYELILIAKVLGVTLNDLLPRPLGDLAQLFKR
ncbi:MAG: helix-turn-helix domain-containing protein [Chthoniobacteraceae bacterium]